MPELVVTDATWQGYYRRYNAARVRCAELSFLDKTDKQHAHWRSVQKWLDWAESAVLRANLSGKVSEVERALQCLKNAESVLDGGKPELVIKRLQRQGEGKQDV